MRVDVAKGQHGPMLHVHTVLSLSDGTTRGAHLLEGRVLLLTSAVIARTFLAADLASLGGLAGH
ncbi:MAG TPA: hypothetical protein VLW50_18195 [Streptosporangiaceae bacterium]|nr:hypothetical protein [Streptosporangiaceae bacterium]